jgi:hypothetical protein
MQVIRRVVSRVNYYRLYYIKNGHFAGFDGFSADDDDDAMRQAEGLSDSRQSELWCGKRKLKVLNATSSQGD